MLIARIFSGLNDSLNPRRLNHEPTRLTMHGIRKGTMAPQIRRSSPRRSLVFAAVPVIAALSVSCTGCSTPSVPLDDVAATEATPFALPENTSPKSDAGPEATVTVSATVGQPPTSDVSDFEVGPLSTTGASASLPPVSVAPSAADDYDPVTAKLAAAIAAKDLDSAQDAVAQGADLEAKDSYGRSALMRALVNDDEAMALRLLSWGADPNNPDDFQDTAFLRSSATGMVPVLRSTIEHGANLHDTNRMGSTALLVASENGEVEAVRLLLQHDVAVNHVNDLGWTALHEAIVLGQGSSNYVSIVRLLLLAGADPTIRDRTGHNALELAEEWGQTQIEQAIRSAAR